MICESWVTPGVINEYWIAFAPRSRRLRHAFDAGGHGVIFIRASAERHFEQIRRCEWRTFALSGCRERRASHPAARLRANQPHVAAAHPAAGQDTPRHRTRSARVRSVREAG